MTLLAPLPLDRPLIVAGHDGGVRLWDGDTLVAEATRWTGSVVAPPATDLETSTNRRH